MVFYSAPIIVNTRAFLQVNSNGTIYTIVKCPSNQKSVK